ncbi:MAG: Holliday junction resolvase RuvX [Flavobacteriales bacterium]
MGRILALDYGTKRVGIAVSDPEKIIANGLTTVHSKDVVQFLKDYMKTENVDTIVVGDPNNLVSEKQNNKLSSIVEDLVKHLKKQFPRITVDKEDESYTSRLAVQTMVEGGMKKKQRQDKWKVDEISACLILQSYMK